MTRPLPRTRTLLAAITLALAACGGGGDGGPGGGNTPTPAVTATVTFGASSFSPSHVAVFTNGTVTWSNMSTVLHNVTFSTGGAPANIPNHDAGANDRVFPTPGVFNYSCTLHAGMTGRVTVVAP